MQRGRSSVLRFRSALATRAPARGAPAIAAVLLLAALAHAQSAAAPAPPAMRVAAPADLAPGMRATVDVFVRPPGGPEQPLLLTPSAEGEAVRVVRGRLLRADARRTAQGELHFQVPIEARSAGTAVLRFALFAYACDERCNEVRLSQTITVQVRMR